MTQHTASMFNRLFEGLASPRALPEPIAKVMRVAAGALALGAASRLQLPFVGTPVPFTLGPQMALVLGALLGPLEGLGAIATWLSMGLGGAPVFASGLVGLPALLAPSGGYALGYLPAAFVVGRWGRGQLWRAAPAWLLASGLILTAGAAALSLSVGLETACAMGVVPFAATDACKALLACAALNAWRGRGKLN